jgi:hypothetical protein
MNNKDFDKTVGALLAKPGDTREEYAILLAEFFADAALKKYQEPTRAGTAKGDPVGLSRKKIRAACLMGLYPGCLKLKEIAEMAGVTVRVLTVWRTHEQFREAMEWGYKIAGAGFGEVIPHNYKAAIEENPDFALVARKLMEALSCFNLHVYNEFFESLYLYVQREQIQDRSFMTSILFMCTQAAEVKDAKSLRKWNIENIEVTKAMISNLTDALLDPEVSLDKRKKMPKT